MVDLGMSVDVRGVEDPNVPSQLEQVQVLDNGDLKNAVVQDSGRAGMHSAAVEAAIADGDVGDAIRVRRRRAVNLERDPIAAIARDDRKCGPQESQPAAPAAPRVFRAGGDGAAHAKARDVDEVSGRRRAVKADEFGFAQVNRRGNSARQNLDGVFELRGNAQSALEISARSQR